MKNTTLSSYAETINFFYKQLEDTANKPENYNTEYGMYLESLSYELRRTLREMERLFT